MKFVLTIFAAIVVVGVSAVPLIEKINSLNGNRSNIVEKFLDAFNGNNSGVTPLDRDFYDFAKLVPLDKLRAIVHKYANDSEIRHSYHFVMSEEFHNLVYAVEALPEHHKMVQSLEAAGVSAIRNIKIIHRALGMKDYVPPPSSTLELKNMKPDERGLTGFIKEYIEILPVEKIKELHQQKLRESQAFIKFDRHIRSSQFRQIVMELTSTEEHKELLKVSLKNGIDCHMIYKLWAHMCGYLP